MPVALCGYDLRLIVSGLWGVGACDGWPHVGTMAMGLIAQRFGPCGGSSAMHRCANVDKTARYRPENSKSRHLQYTAHAGRGGICGRIDACTESFHAGCLWVVEAGGPRCGCGRLISRSKHSVPPQ